MICSDFRPFPASLIKIFLLVVEMQKLRLSGGWRLGPVLRRVPAAAGCAGSVIGVFMQSWEDQTV